MDFALGLDIGGTKIEGAIISDKGKIFDKYRTETHAEKSRLAIVNNITTVIKKLINTEIIGIGLGVPGFVDKHGKILFMPNISKLINFNIKTYLEKKFKLPIKIDNDANCFTLAEHLYGAGRGYDNMIGLILGTGIGAGIIINGKIYAGKTGSAGEFGHCIIDPTADEIHRNYKGDFESFCSGPNIVARYKEAGGKNQDVTVEHILKLKSSDSVAKQIRKETIKYLAIGVGNIINSLNPDIIVFGGGVSNANFYRDLKHELKRYTIPEPLKHVKILKNKLGGDSGVIGAASLVFC
ncbi:hypothetical protein DRJ17_02375 [Candidatus Woesearchaeota archaeon]|nr:MAG: hypothetical protein DRJ17_02375 [Candidatus Woesearchaeota archaeon]